MSKEEYTTLPLLPSTASDAAPRKKGGCRAGLAVVKALLVGVGLFVCLNTVGLSPIPRCVTDRLSSEHHWKAEEQCAQSTAVVPTRNAELWGSLGDTYSTDAFKSRAVERLGGAVRVP